MEKKEIKPLTSFRFLAAMAVFLFHLPDFKSGREHVYFPKGYLGVTFFFLLSGFVLAYNYYDRLSSLDISKIKKFYLARFGRVYPVYFLTFLASLPFVIHVHYFSGWKKALSAALINLLTLQSFFPKEHIFLSFNPPSWSISDEFFFYLMFPFIIFAFSKMRTGRIKALLFSAALFCLEIAAILLLQNKSGLETTRWMFFVCPFFRLIDFTLGILLFHLFRETEKFSRSGANIFTWLEILAIGLMALSFHWTSPDQPAFFMSSARNLPCVGFLIYIFAFSKGKISSFFSNGLLVFLGELSFSLYMIHYLVFWAIGLDPHTDHLSAPAAGLLGLSVSLTLSFFCYKYYEMPMRDRIKENAAKRS